MTVTLPAVPSAEYVRALARGARLGHEYGALTVDTAHDKPVQERDAADIASAVRSALRSLPDVLERIQVAAGSGLFSLTLVVAHMAPADNIAYCLRLGWTTRCLLEPHGYTSVLKSIPDRETGRLHTVTLEISWS